MSGKKVVILDGYGILGQDLAPVLGALSDVLGRDGSQIETIPSRKVESRGSRS